MLAAPARPGRRAGPALPGRLDGGGARGDGGRAAGGGGGARSGGGDQWSKARGAAAAAPAVRDNRAGCRFMSPRESSPLVLFISLPPSLHQVHLLSNPYSRMIGACWGSKVDIRFAKVGACGCIIMKIKMISYKQGMCILSAPPPSADCNKHSSSLPPSLDLLRRTTYLK